MQDCCFSFKKKTAINAGPVLVKTSLYQIQIEQQMHNGSSGSCLIQI